ncbi:Leucine-rich repeat-containing protein [Artemisia annua]|uniref:Leucine-rich repeat-containing protein n=1 Tax=Artemisia annua TaxID=35608 RepID=A0A2U1KFK0_ARTAN|nr:Leucine-rich repeat-containing protein [Artemisia annua]
MMIQELDFLKLRPRTALNVMDNFGNFSPQYRSYCVCSQGKKKTTTNNWPGSWSITKWILTMRPWNRLFDPALIICHSRCNATTTQKFSTFASSLNNNHTRCPKKQSEALLLFKHNLSSINYPNDDCGPGDIPLKIPVNLTHLTHLDLSFNSLNGTLPSWLFTSPSLESLHLSYNMFSGNVPFDSFASPSLKELYLSNNNQLGGQIDVQTFPQLTNLTDLYLSDNNFSGELELDTLLSTLTNLYYLDLSHSGFSVTTNNSNHYVNPGFRSLQLASCKLKVFPNSFRAMKQLYYLDLSSNEIHGQIPHWAGEIGVNELYYLNLSHNFITGLPQFQWYGLYELYLQSNLIEGPFPPSICNMSKLQFLDMSNNSFGGLIPQCFGNISSYVRMIDMGNNSFQGTIPNVYGDCGRLEGLILNGNQLEGEVPSSLSKCLSLKVGQQVMKGSVSLVFLSHQVLQNGQLYSSKIYHAANVNVDSNQNTTNIYTPQRDVTNRRENKSNGKVYLRPEKSKVLSFGLVMLKRDIPPNAYAIWTNWWSRLLIMFQIFASKCNFLNFNVINQDQELDFLNEARNNVICMDNFRKLSPHIADYVYAPKVYWNLSTTKLLTMEFVEGAEVNDLQSIQKLGINPHDIARLVSRTFAEMMFKHGGCTFLAEHMIRFVNWVLSLEIATLTNPCVFSKIVAYIPDPKKIR